jgi:hypothetical protein
VYEVRVKAFLPVTLLLFPGCARLDAVNGLADPVVAQGMYLGIDVPDGVDLSDADGLQYSALCNVFLAYVADPSELADAPVEGAKLTFKSPANGLLRFREEGGGKYTLDSTDGLVYEVGDTPIVSFTMDEAEAKLEVLAPEAPEVDLPASVDREDPLDVDLSGYDYQNVVAASYDLTHGKLTWDNLPTAVDEVYDFTHTDTPIERVEIPGDAFLRKGAYVVGVAGMQVADPVSFEGVNTTLSAFIAGRLGLGLVSVNE